MRVSKSWNFSEIDVLELLPQAPPFIFVHRILDFNIEELSCITAFTVLDHTVFLEHGNFSESGLLENIAQTCAVHIGFYNKYILKKKIQVGFIGAVKNLRIFDNIQINDTLTTKITILTEFGSMKIAEAKVFRDTQLLAEGELKIALQE